MRHACCEQPGGFLQLDSASADGPVTVALVPLEQGWRRLRTLVVKKFPNTEVYSARIMARVVERYGSKTSRLSCSFDSHGKVGVVLVFLCVFRWLQSIKCRAILLGLTTRPVRPD